MHACLQKHVGRVFAALNDDVQPSLAHRPCILARNHSSPARKIWDELHEVLKLSGFRAKGSELGLPEAITSSDRKGVPTSKELKLTFHETPRIVAMARHL